MFIIIYTFDVCTFSAKCDCRCEKMSSRRALFVMLILKEGFVFYSFFPQLAGALVRGNSQRLELLILWARVCETDQTGGYSIYL